MLPKEINSTDFKIDLLTIINLSLELVFSFGTLLRKVSEEIQYLIFANSPFPIHIFDHYSLTLFCHFIFCHLSTKYSSTFFWRWSQGKFLSSLPPFCNISMKVSCLCNWKTEYRWSEKDVTSGFYTAVWLYPLAFPGTDDRAIIQIVMETGLYLLISTKI